MTQQRPYRVGIVGSYGGLNLGDEAILQSIVTQLRESVPAAITVFARNPTDTDRRHGVEHAVATRSLSRDELASLIEELDVLVVGGGGILFDAEAQLYLREATLAHELGVPVMVYAVGAGPLRDPAVQTVVRECLDRVAVITVREAKARRVLEDTGVRQEIRVTADPALLLHPEPISEDSLPAELSAAERPLVGMSVREPGAAAPDLSEDVYHQLLANAADFMVDRFGAEVVFVPMERSMLDMQHSHAVIARMVFPQRASVLKGEYTPSQLLTLVARFDFAVGMRLHFLILAALAKVPFVALPYAGKVGGFLEQVEVETPPPRAGQCRPPLRPHRPLLGPAPIPRPAGGAGAAQAPGARAGKPPYLNRAAAAGWPRTPATRGKTLTVTARLTRHALALSSQ